MPRIESLSVTLRRQRAERAAVAPIQTGAADSLLELWLEFNGHRIAALATHTDDGAISAKFWPRSMSHSVALVVPTPALWDGDAIQVAVAFDTDGGTWNVDFEPEPLQPGQLIDIWAERPTPIWRV